ncbi:hypothetical protein R80B4_00801 [Fibrobacteres bacterium R8-0-B4]
MTASTDKSYRHLSAIMIPTVKSPGHLPVTAIFTGEPARHALVTAIFTPRITPSRRGTHIFTPNRYIVKSINAMLHLEILTGCEEFVNAMNAVIHRYKTMIHQQQGHHHGTGTTPPSGGPGGDVIHPVGGEEE